MSHHQTKLGEPRVLLELKRAMSLRERHKVRVRCCQLALDNAGPSTRDWLLVQLLKAQEASRGSKIRARRLHEQWQGAVRVIRPPL